jgi:lactate permease
VYEQVYEPVAGSLALSALVAAIPIVVLFVLLAGVRVAAQWASLATLAVALVIAVLVYGMPVGLALDSTLLGVAFGLFPIVWIVLNTTFLEYKRARSCRALLLPRLCHRALQPLAGEASRRSGGAPLA